MRNAASPVETGIARGDCGGATGCGGAGMAAGGGSGKTGVGSDGTTAAWRGGEGDGGWNRVRPKPTPSAITAANAPAPTNHGHRRRAGAAVLPADAIVDGAVIDGAGGAMVSTGVGVGVGAGVGAAPRVTECAWVSICAIAPAEPGRSAGSSARAASITARKPASYRPAPISTAGAIGPIARDEAACWRVMASVTLPPIAS